jgi:hypothetical protein
VANTLLDADTEPMGHAAVPKSDLHGAAELVAQKAQRVRAAEDADARAQRDASVTPEERAERYGALRFAQQELARARYEFDCIVRDAARAGLR